ncbi:MAG: hypothetical protein GY953_52795 [bacterium]|nr:hypothetical protein [bacterium]
MEVPLLGKIQMLTDLGRARFARYSWPQLLATLGPSFLSSTGTCWLAPYRGVLPDQVDPITGSLLDVGPALILTGPQGTKELTRLTVGPRAGEYEGDLGGGGLGGGGEPGFLEPGTFTISAPGGTGENAVGTFEAALTLPQPVVWENADEISEIHRTEDLEVTWSPGDPGATVAITGSSANSDANAGVAFACNVPANLGRFTVPSYIFLSLPPSGGNALSPTAFFLVGEYGPPKRFTANSLDVGIFTYVVVKGKTVVYK